MKNKQTLFEAIVFISFISLFIVGLFFEKLQSGAIWALFLTSIIGVPRVINFFNKNDKQTGL